MIGCQCHDDRHIEGGIAVRKNLKIGFVCMSVAAISLAELSATVDAQKAMMESSEIAAEIEKAISEMGSACKKFSDRVSQDRNAIADSEQAFRTAEPYEKRIDALYRQSIDTLSRIDGKLPQEAALQIGANVFLLFDGMAFSETMITNATETQNGLYVKGPMKAAIRILACDSLNADQVELLMAKIPPDALGKAYRYYRQLSNVPERQREVIGKALLWRLAFESECATESVGKSLGVKI